MGFLSSLFGGSQTRQQQTQDPGFIFPEQVPGLAQNFQAGGQLAQAQAGPISQTAFPLAQQLGQQGQGFLSGLGQAAGGQLDQFIGPGFTGQQIGALGAGLQRNLGQSLGQINQQAVGSGGFGGTRQGVAQGTAIGDTQLAFQQGATDILQQDFGRRQQAATAQAGLQGQTAIGGLGQLGGQFNLGLAPFQAQFQPLLNQAQILGQPQPLSGASQGTTDVDSSLGGLVDVFATGVDAFDIFSGGGGGGSFGDFGFGDGGIDIGGIGQQGGGGSGGGIFGNAASGAATGAQIGGPWGALIGGVAGGLFGAFT